MDDKKRITEQQYYAEAQIEKDKRLGAVNETIKDQLAERLLELFRKDQRCADLLSGCDNNAETIVIAFLQAVSFFAILSTWQHAPKDIFDSGCDEWAKGFALSHNVEVKRWDLDVLELRHMLNAAFEDWEEMCPCP